MVRKHFITMIVCMTFLSIPGTGKTQEQSLWENLGLYGGQIYAIAIDPSDPQTMYTGSWGGDGLFKSTDGGESWFTIPEDNPSWFRNLEVFDIAIDPNNPSNIWVANNHYVDVSYDYGETWQSFSFASDEGRFCWTVEIDPSDATGNAVYVGTGGTDSSDENGEMFRTLDGGVTWEAWVNWSTSIERNNFWCIKFNPNVPGEMWVANRKSFLSPDGLIYVSTDHGDNWWTWWGAVQGDYFYEFGYLDGVMVHPEDPRIIFTHGENGIARKQNGASSGTGNDIWNWTDVVDVDNGTRSCRAMAIPPVAPDTVYAGLVYNIAKSTDAGITWDVSTETPSEFLALEAHPADAAIVFGGSVNRGIYKSSDAAETWIASNQGIRANTIYDTDLSPDQPDKILAGTVAGLYVLANGSWELIEDSSAEAVALHPSEPDTIYAGFDWSLGKSIDGGKNWLYLYTPDQANSNGVSAIGLVPHGNGSDDIYMGVAYGSGKYGELIKVYGWGYDSYEYDETVFTDAVPVNAVAVDPADTEHILVGTGSFYAPVAPGGLYVSSNGGTSWKRKLRFKDIVVNSISIAPSNPDIIYIGCGSSSAQYSGIYKSTDGGTTWESKAEGMPYLFAVSDLHVDEQDPDTVYAAVYYGSNDGYTDIGGSYLSLDGGNFWTQIGLSDYQMLDINSYAASAASPKKLKISATQSVSVPNSTMLAGTASGLYQTTTAGTGFITGSVINAESGALVDGAHVLTSYSNCISSQGYYFMLVPSGTYSLRVNASGYIQQPTQAVIVNSGGMSTMDILLLPSEVDNDTTCIATALLPAAEAPKLALLREFRDRTLSHSMLGRFIIDTYYRMGPKLLPVIRSNPDLAAHARGLLMHAIRIAKEMLAHKKTLPPYLLDDVGSLLMRIEAASPKALQPGIKELRKKLKHVRTEDLFKKADLRRPASPK